MSLTHAQKELIRRQADEFLGRSKSFHAMPHHRQTEIASNTADVLELLADDVGTPGSVLELLGKKPMKMKRDPYAEVMKGGSPILGRPANQLIRDRRKGGSGGGAEVQPGQFGQGVMTGVHAAGALIQEVDFPVFVAELVRGVFQAVVDSTIQQMEAYAELVQSVALSLNEFRDQNVSKNQARDHLVSKYPSLMQISVQEGEPRVVPREGAGFGELPNFQEDFGLDEEVSDLDEEIIEEVLVPAARNELAERRQKLLATMVLMGINRIVVTDGRINAKVKFNFYASDRTASQAFKYNYKNLGTTSAVQSEYDRGAEYGEREYYDDGSLKKTGAGNYYTTGKYQYVNTPVIRLQSQSQTNTDAELQAQGQLTGEVRLNFKSETLPLEELVDNDQVVRLSEARGTGRGTRPSGQGQAQRQGAAAPQTAAV